MIKQSIMKLAGAAALVCMGTAGPALGADERVVYKGDSAARGVCMSIVRDDVGKLRQALRLGKTNILERAHLNYACNKLALDEFAFTQNAEQVSAYLAPKFGHKGTVTIEQVGSINE